MIAIRPINPSICLSIHQVPGAGHYPFYTGQPFPPSSIPYYDGLGGAPFDVTQLAWDFLKGASMSPPPINDCPVGCVSVNARQRRQLLFGVLPPECPKGCVAA